MSVGHWMAFAIRTTGLAIVCAALAKTVGWPAAIAVTFGLALSTVKYVQPGTDR